MGFFSENVVASAQQPKLKVTKTKISMGNGSITSDDGLINCGTICSRVYDRNTSVNLTATPDANSAFTGWSGVCSGTGVCTITMDKAKSVKAIFAAYRLKVIKTSKKKGTGSVTSVPSGISCGTTCQKVYPSSSVVTLTALPDFGASFTGWTPKSLCPGTGTCTVTMNSAKTVTATFTATDGSSSDTTPPTVPYIMSYTTSATQVDFYWYGSTDAGNAGLAGYIIYRDGVRIATVDSSAYSYTDTGMLPDTVYTYTISAYDNAFNESSKATPIRIIPGLMASFSFDEDFGNIASSGTCEANDGIIANAHRVEGAIGQALKFDLDGSYISSAGDYHFKDGLVTIEAWIKPDTVEAGKVYAIIGDYGEMGLNFQIRDGKLEVFFGGRSYHYGASMIAPNVWTHIAFVSDGKDIITYINGNEDGRTNITLPIQWISNLLIGTHLVYPEQYIEQFSGIMDELRIWSIARSQNEIAAHAAEQLMTPQKVSIANPAPEGFYNFNETSGNIAKDESGNKQDGIIVAASRVEGKIGNGLKLGLDDSYVSIAPMGFYFDKGLITIEAWIKPDTVETGKVYRIIGGFGYSEAYFQIRDGRLEVLFNGKSYHYGTLVIAPNVWTHIAFVSDGKDIITYINGNEDGRTNVTLPTRWMGNILVGATHTLGNYVEEFPGIMDELRVWNGVRTPDQIHQYYDSTK